MIPGVPCSPNFLNLTCFPSKMSSMRSGTEPHLQQISAPLHSPPLPSSPLPSLPPSPRGVENAVQFSSVSQPSKHLPTHLSISSPGLATSAFPPRAPMRVSWDNIIWSPLPKACLFLPLEGIIFTCSEEESLHVLVTPAKKRERPRIP